MPRLARLNLLLFATTGCVYLLSGKTFFGYDGEIMYRVSESIVLRHSLQIVDPIYHTNQPYGAYGIGLSLLMVPLIAAGSLVLHDPRALVSLLEPSVTAATVVALNLLLVELGCSWQRSLAIVLVYAFGTLAWSYSGVLYTEPVIALCLVSALLALLAYQRRAEWPWLAAAGAAAALAILLRWDSAMLVAAPLTVYALIAVGRLRSTFRQRVLDLIGFGGPIALAVVVNLSYDIVRFQHALGGPYRADPFGFSTPLLKGLFGLWLSPGVGLVIYTPILLMSIVGLPNLFRRWPAEATIVGVVVVVRSVFYARYWAWEGGATWGPRFLIPLTPLLLLPLAFLPRDRRVDIAALGLAAIGFLIQVLGQLVPYGLYYGTVVPQLMTQLGFCHGCLPFPGAQSQAVNEITDFDLRYVPLVVQARYLIAGVMAPAWGPIAVAMPLLIAGVTAALLRIGHLAARLDAQVAHAANAPVA